MRRYYTACTPSSWCGHHHRTRAAARRCARTWPWGVTAKILRVAIKRRAHWRILANGRPVYVGAGS